MKKISKQLKKTGKIIIDGPKVKSRKRSAPPVQVHKSKKSYDRKEKPVDTIEEQEHMNLLRFIDAIHEEKYADAAKYLQHEIDIRMEALVSSYIDTPLF